MPGITYETVFIAEPEIPAEQIDQLVGKIKETISAHKGSVTAEDRWGRRRLAYPIHGHREGFYTILSFTAEPTVVNALEHLYNVTDSVIRQLTVRHYPSNKKFAPRRERPAGEVHRSGSGRTGGSPRGPAGSPARPAAAAETPAPASETSPTPAQGEKA